MSSITATLARHRATTAVDAYKPVAAKTGRNVEPDQILLLNLLTDLRFWAVERNLPFGRLVDQSASAYLEEVGDAL